MDLQINSTHIINFYMKNVKLKCCNLSEQSHIPALKESQN
jgi:hypothetical protein